MKIAMELEHFQKENGRLPGSADEVLRKYEGGDYVVGPATRGKYDGWELFSGQQAKIVARKKIQDGSKVICFEIDSSFNVTQREE